jgi:hypothetical protein
MWIVPFLARGVVKSMPVDVRIVSSDVITSDGFPSLFHHILDEFVAFDEIFDFCVNLAQLP